LLIYEQVRWRVGSHVSLPYKDTTVSLTEEECSYIRTRLIQYGIISLYLYLNTFIMKCTKIHRTHNDVNRYGKLVRMCASVF